MLNLASIRAAHARIRDKIHRTPVLTSEQLDRRAGASLFFKCENFQKVGAFKARGATNAVFSLSDTEAARGVATHSSGNHAASLARAAKLRGINAHIVMPSTVAKPKQAAVRGYGATVILCEPTLAAREAACAAVIAETGAVLVHPYNDEAVMAGQGTAALELLEDIPELDVVLAPVSGGGLLAGTAVAAKGLRSHIRVLGVEPQQADDAARSFREGRIVSVTPHTIADGLRGTLGEKNFVIIRSQVDDIVTVSEDAIVAAMRAIWETLKIVVEPSAAVTYAAILENKLPVAGQRVGLLVTGGNVDLDALPWLRRDPT
jgi:threonine dehydratase